MVTTWLTHTEPLWKCGEVLAYPPTNSKNSNKSSFSESESLVLSSPSSLFPVKTSQKGNYSSQDNQALGEVFWHLRSYHGNRLRNLNESVTWKNNKMSKRKTTIGRDSFFFAVKGLRALTPCWRTHWRRSRAVREEDKPKANGCDTSQGFQGSMAEGVLWHRNDESGRKISGQRKRAQLMESSLHRRDPFRGIGQRVLLFSVMLNIKPSE